MSTPRRTSYSNTKLPSLKGYSCTVLTGAFYSDVVKMMMASGFAIEEDYKKADLVVFTGGSDVHPSFYGEEPIPECYTNKRRDEIEKQIYDECVKLKKPMFGICRGLQFLHAMNGGKLYQDTNNHAGGRHGMIDLDTNELVPDVSSIHHQMCIYNPDIMSLIGVAPYARSKYYKTANGSLRGDENKLLKYKSEAVEIMIPGSVFEVEAAAYPQTLCFGVQGHPEICAGGPYQAWTMDFVKDFLMGHIAGVGMIKSQLAQNT